MLLYTWKDIERKLLLNKDVANTSKAKEGESIVFIKYSC